MHPVFITLAGRDFYWYGVMMALAFLSGILAWRHLARCKGRPADYGSDLSLWVLLPGLLGARLLYVFANWHYYSAAPSEIWRLDHGGLIFYGGIIGGLLGALAFARRHRESVVALIDFLVVPVPLGHFFGRIGCFLNGCCYGLPAPAAWGWSLSGEDGFLSGGCGVAMAGDPTPRWPVQLYEAAGNLLIFAILYPLYRRRPVRGLATAVYLVLYPSLRLGLEFLRGDSRQRAYGLNAAQWLSLALIATGSLMALHAYRATKRPIKLEVRDQGSRPAP